MPASFDIEFEGQSRVSCESLGIVVESRTLQHNGVDTVRLTLRKHGVNDEQLIPARSFVTLWKHSTPGDAGERWFHGLSENPTYLAAATTDEQTLTIRGPEHLLENVAWRHEITEPDFHLPIEDDASVGVLATRQWTQLRERIETALSGYLTVPTSWPATFPQLRLGSCPQTIGSLAQNIRALMKWVPGAARRWNYTAEVPAMELVMRGESVKTFAYGDTLAEFNLKDVSCEAPLTTRLRAFERTSYDVGSLGQERFDQLGNWWFTNDFPTLRPAGTGAREWEILTIYDHYLTLQTYYYSREVEGAQFAAFVLEHLMALNWQGSAVFRDEAIATTLQPGDTINFTGTHARFETMNALVQSVTEVPSMGETTITVGFPEHLDTSNLFSLYRQIALWTPRGKQPFLPRLIG